VKRQVTLQLGEFAMDAIERQARALGISADRLVREALIYYVSDLSSERLAARPPRIAAESSGRFQREVLELCVDVDARTWEELESEAARYEMPLERLLGHATLYYLADLEAGRVAARIVEGLDENSRS
jgi:hypothetical protein